MPSATWGSRRLTPRYTASDPPRHDPQAGIGIRTAAVKLAILRALKARIKEVEIEVTAELSGLDVGDTKAATLEDGTRLGKVTMTAGRETPTIVDEEAFYRWVLRNHPTEVITAVRPAYRDKVFASAKRNGLPVDETSGEVIPGVELRVGEPSLSFRGDPGYTAVVAERWAEVGASALLLGGEV